MRLFYTTLVVSAVMTFALAVTWSTPYPLIFGVNSLGVLIQLAAVAIFIPMIRSRESALTSVFSSFSRKLLALACAAFIIKILIQTAVAVPAVAEISYTIRNFVVGFIHLLMLGCLSLFAFAMIGEITGRAMNTVGTWIFVAGVVTTELLLFGQGIALWIRLGFMAEYHLLLALLSCLLFVGVTVNTVQFILKRV